MGIVQTHTHAHTHGPTGSGILNRTGNFNSSITMPSDSSLDLNINRLTSNHSGLNALRVQVVCETCPCVSGCPCRRVYWHNEHCGCHYSKHFVFHKIIKCKTRHSRQDIRVALHSLQSYQYACKHTHTHTCMNAHTLYACLENNCIPSDNC